jgi:hypothetical protein
MDDAERLAARDVVVQAAKAIAHRHGDAEVGEAEFAVALVNLRAAAQIELELCVSALRSGGSSWADIGALLGVSRQAAQQQFGGAAAAYQTSREVDSQEALTALVALLPTLASSAPRARSTSTQVDSQLVLTQGLGAIALLAGR